MWRHRGLCLRAQVMRAWIDGLSRWIQRLAVGSIPTVQKPHSGWVAPTASILQMADLQVRGRVDHGGLETSQDQVFNCVEEELDERMVSALPRENWDCGTYKPGNV